MGTQIASAPSTGGKRFSEKKMLHFALLVAFSGLASAAPGYGGYATNNQAEAHSGYSYGIHNTNCHTEYDTKIDTARHTEYDQACHTEYDTVVDTTYVEDCQDIVTEQCHQVSQQVHHNSGVVGHNSQVHPGGYAGHGYGKREADPSYGHHGHTTGPQCHANTERQCQQRPVQNSRQIPREVCHPVPREVCVPVEVRVPRPVCHDYQVEGEHHTHGGIVGHAVAPVVGHAAVGLVAGHGAAYGH